MIIFRIEAVAQVVRNTGLLCPWPYEQERHTIENELILERLTLVSGSGGVMHLVYLQIEKKHFEIQVQGNFEVATQVFHTMLACTP